MVASKLPCCLATAELLEVLRDNAPPRFVLDVTIMGHNGYKRARFLQKRMQVTAFWKLLNDAASTDDATGIAAYLNAALEDGDTSVIAAALGDIARAKVFCRAETGEGGISLENPTDSLGTH